LQSAAPFKTISEGVPQ